MKNQKNVSSVFRLVNYFSKLILIFDNKYSLSLFKRIVFLTESMPTIIPQILKQSLDVFMKQALQTIIINFPLCFIMNYLKVVRSYINKKRYTYSLDDTSLSKTDA